jgi:hypothetical protein
MASLTTYLLVSGAEDLDEVRQHPVVAERDLDVHDSADPETGSASLTFVDTAALEEAADHDETAQTLSSAFPSAVVQLCVVEERFDQVERLRTVLYRNGTSAGEIEHGYIFNIGSG